MRSNKRHSRKSTTDGNNPTSISNSSLYSESSVTSEPTNSPGLNRKPSSSDVHPLSNSFVKVPDSSRLKPNMEKSLSFAKLLPLQFQNSFHLFEDKVEKSSIIQQLGKMSNIPGMYIGYGLLATFLVGSLFNLFQGIFIHLVGSTYPAYRSFKSLESCDKTITTHWLTYWVVYTCFIFIETFTDKLLFWVPMYYLVKAAGIFYLVIPETNGTRHIYETILRPFLLKEEKNIDAGVEKIKSSAYKLGVNAVNSK
ncbi:TB2/DP1, HVA22 family-domain-containing protein [Globomyces pollinis-pini]|nr:TB2/DP1, HVA22 family-domain-containing protein [Globomyces pollinis-pini]